MTRSRWLGMSIALAAAAVPHSVVATLTGPSSPNVKFVAIGPAGMNIVGESSALKFADDGRTVVVTAPLTALHTGIELRDRHMKEKYLEVAKYPNATVRITRNTLQIPTPGASISRDTSGELNLHGRDKRITFHYQAKRAGSGFDVTGTLHLNIKDYAIEVPSYLGVSVKPDVDVSVQFHVDGS